MGKNWKESLGFLSPKATPHEIGDKELNFYPLSLQTIFRLRSLSGPLGEAITTLLQKSDRDHAETHREFDHGPGNAGSEIVLEPVSVEMAKMRLETRAQAIKKLMDTITDENNKILIGCIIVDSMRDIFDRDMPDDEIEQVMKSEVMTVDHIVGLLIGVAKANKRVFGPFADQVSDILNKALKTSLDQAQKETDNPDSTEDEAQKE